MRLVRDSLDYCGHGRYPLKEGCNRCYSWLLEYYDTARAAEPDGLREALESTAKFLTELLQRPRNDNDSLVLDGYEQDEIEAVAQDARRALGVADRQETGGLREALAFYADSNNWPTSWAGNPRPAFAVYDRGERARRALKETK